MCVRTAFPVTCGFTEYPNNQKILTYKLTEPRERRIRVHRYYQRQDKVASRAFDGDASCIFSLCVHFFHGKDNKEQKLGVPRLLGQRGASPSVYDAEDGFRQTTSSLADTEKFLVGMMDFERCSEDPRCMSTDKAPNKQ